MRSIFLRRLLILLVAALIVASLCMYAGNAFVIRNVYIDAQTSELTPRAETVRQLMTEFAHGNMTRSAFTNVLYRLVEDSASAVFIVYRDQSVVWSGGAAMTEVPTETLRDVLSADIARVLTGETLERIDLRIGEVGRVLMVGLPFIVDGSVEGAIFVMMPMTNIEANLNRFNSSLIVIILILLPIIMVIASLPAGRIAAPLRRMSDVAKEMSTGNFGVRADETQEGEAGVLAKALNDLCAALSGTIFELRSEKSQLNQLLSSLSDGVAATDGLGMLTTYNPALMNMFGAVSVNTREELIPDASVWRVFDNVFATGTPQTITYPMAGDRVLWITVSPVVAENGVRTGVVGLFKDMTEMEHVEQMRREYVANVSHELRTPLTGIRGLLEPLADGMVTDEETVKRYYKTMLHEVLRLSRLISDMMMLSRLQSGTEYMQSARVDVNELLTDVAATYSREAANKGIELKVDAPDVPDAMTDPDRVEQVLIILIDNAMRYTPKGGSITLKVSDGARLRVCVADTGCGIPEKDLPLIFERFYKVDKSRKEGGTGLGLSIASYIMEKLEEDFTVQSKLGEGTCFSFTLKKYVDNAIQLGPPGKWSPEDDEPEPEAPKLDPEDAQYEVIREPKTRKRGRHE